MTVIVITKTFFLNLFAFCLKTPMIYNSIEDVDPEMNNLIKLEEKRQKESLELIASENFTSISVLQANASVLTNKYSEGKIGERYYGGNEIIDQIEILCKKRALELFKLDPEVWDVNVQTLSGSIANMAVYLGIIGKDGKLMGLDLPSGGHLTHGYKTNKKKISSSSIFFESSAYKCGENEEIDYNQLQSEFEKFKPELLICGGSAYLRDFDYKKLREIVGDKYLMMDMAHTSGFVAHNLMNNPFEYCDVVTTTTHKLMRGPRSAMIFYKKFKKMKVNDEERTIDIKTAIDSAVFPGIQGGPHNQKIAALAVALKQANSEEYKEYVQQVIRNTQVLVKEFTNLGYRLYSKGSDCHMILLCLEGGVDGFYVEKICEMVNISVNRNCIATDKSPFKPSAIRLGTPALTTRGLKEQDFIKVSRFIDEAIKLTKELFDEHKENILKAAHEDSRLPELKKKVIEFISKFDIPCFDFRK